MLTSDTDSTDLTSSDDTNLRKYRCDIKGHVSEPCKNEQ